MTQHDQTRIEVKGNLGICVSGRHSSRLTKNRTNAPENHGKHPLHTHTHMQAHVKLVLQGIEFHSAIPALSVWIPTFLRVRLLAFAPILKAGSSSSVQLLYYY